MSANTVLRERARMRENALHDEASALQGAKEEDKAEGIAIGENSVVEKMRKSRITEEQIKSILSQ